MGLFICGSVLGGVIGVGFMCLLQVDRHNEIMEDLKGEK
ncbi:MAG: inseCt neurotoxin 1c [Bacilli bacterium]|nr:inseCt neurotoxin 1c [Bacilli bacterium]